MTGHNAMSGQFGLKVINGALCVCAVVAIIAGLLLMVAGPAKHESGVF